MLYLKQNGIVIFLEADPALLQARISNFNSRGLIRLPEQSFTDLYHERMPLYQEYAEYIYSCGQKDEEKISEELVQWLRHQNGIQGAAG